MFRFTIRDLLWLTMVVAIATVWLIDRDKIRQQRERLAKREAELTSTAKMWRAEADRASLRAQDARDYSQKVQTALRMRGMEPQEIFKFNDTVQQLFDADKQQRSNQPPPNSKSN